MSEIALADAARESLLKVEDLREEAEVLKKRQAEERHYLLPAPLQKKMKSLERRHQAEADALSERLKAVEAATKQLTIELGETVAGEALQCCYHEGRTTWNSDKLNVMAHTYPLIDDARSVGEPSASLRKRAQ